MQRALSDHPMIQSLAPFSLLIVASGHQDSAVTSKIHANGIHVPFYATCLTCAALVRLCGLPEVMVCKSARKKRWGAEDCALRARRRSVVSSGAQNECLICSARDALCGAGCILRCHKEVSKATFRPWTWS